MLNNKQKRALRREAHSLKPLFQIGKEGMNEQIITHVDEAIEKREILKVNLLQNCMEDKHEVAAELAEGTGSEVVQVIGSTIVLYRRSKDNPGIELPK
ncbi:RNA-binding protein [Marinococcus halophilus]|uniref:Putative RNA-binding protein YqeI n=1 Tax=Marinococcus halophilus TaxID=1371 RepID=A0A510Y6H9_MARHA|nr:ribosome assembly RNA-binding protein YhbY [Marinococcus halophilus]OZT81062.1 RNA-binding protein [Marinococcus halophilus]GEK58773.1 putative RNA-binding protein YqeI [Marinococcus halophilus]